VLTLSLIKRRKRKESKLPPTKVGFENGKLTRVMSGRKKEENIKGTKTRGKPRNPKKKIKEGIVRRASIVHREGKIRATN